MARAGRSFRLAAAILTAGMLAAACAGGGAGDGGDQTAEAGQDGGNGQVFQIGIVGEQDQDVQPVRGGTLSVAMGSILRSLDPTESLASACCGGIEMIAIYDVLMRYDPETGEYEPQLAKSLEHSDDYRTWTLTLRQGVTFSDGTPLDAQAVLWSINRYIDKETSKSGMWDRNVASMDTPDRYTVVFHLNRSWPGFVYLLATDLGLIVSPTSVQGGQFTPIGAGAFTVKNFSPAEELVLSARKDYWGGRPHLDGVRFVPISGGKAQLETLATGGVQAAFIQSEQYIVEARERGYPGFMNLVNLGLNLLINNRPGRPGSDPRVRRAISYAINPEVVVERAYDGAGLPGKALFQEFSRWHTDAAPLSYNPQKARQLLTQAKNDGYDGRITYVSSQTGIGRDLGLAVKAMLDSVGFSVTLNFVRTTADLIRTVGVDHDFGIAQWAINITEASVFPEFYVTLHSQSTRNYSGYANPKMDGLIRELQAAATDEAKRQVIAQIQQLWRQEVPAIVNGAGGEFVAWDQSVHGIIPTVDSMVLLHDAFIAK